MTVDEIHEAFSDVRYPGDAALAEYWPNEWESTLRRLRGKKWHEVTAADFDSQGGIVEGIQCLSTVAFIYFLPGLISLALTEPAHRYALVSALLSLLTVPDYQHSSAQSPQAKVIGLLSMRQRDVARQFFLDMLSIEPMLCRPVVESAARNLREGQITPYSQNEVLEWARRRR